MNASRSAASSILAPIASVLLQQALGRRPNRRMLELIQLHNPRPLTAATWIAPLPTESGR